MWSVTLSVRRNVYVAVMVALAVCGGVMAAQAAMVQDDAMARGWRVAPIGMDPETIGSGDGRIHIIPSLSAPSVKNGERLTIQAVVKAMDGVASVTARIEKEGLQSRSGFQPLRSDPSDQPDRADQATSRNNRPDHPFLPDFSLHGILNPPVATLTLQGAPMNLGGINAAGTIGMWQAEWTASGLEEGYYRINITVTDHAGHAYTDASLRFSDPIAGNNTPGAANYPYGGMRRMDAVTLNSGENRLHSAVIDAANGYAYFGTYTSPGWVVKVALGAGADPPTRVSAVTLASGENLLGSAVIDAANGYAYFGTYTSPGRVVKVALGAGDDPPSRVGAVTLDEGESYLYSAVIDAVNGYAYFGTSTDPGRVVKVALGAGSNSPSRVGAVTLDSAEGSLISAVIDAANGYAYFGTGAFPGSVVKVALGVGLNPPSRVGAVALDSGENRLRCAVIDAANGHAYFGTGQSGSPGRVVKVALGAGSNPPSRVGAVTLDSGEDHLISAVIDAANGYAYFGTNTSPGRVVKVALGEGDDPPSRVGAVALDSGEDHLISAVIDAANGYAWFGTWTSPGRVVKVALGEGSNSPTRVGAVTLDESENYLDSAVIDAANGYAWFGTETDPGRVVKVALGEGSDPPTRVGAVTLDTGENRLQCAVIDAINGYAYFGTYTGPGRVVKVALGAGSNPPSRVGAITLASDDARLRSAVIDAINGYAYFGTYDTQPGRVVKVALGVGSNPPTRVGTVTLDSGKGGGVGEGEDYLASAVIDAANGYAWFGTATSPGRVVRVALSQQGFVKGTRFTMPEDGTVQSLSFYSHAAAGNLRLGLYSAGAPPALLWESAPIANTAANTWLTAPVSGGTPSSLTLPAGDYWLCWQVDTMAAVPSYAAGTTNEGLLVPYSWDAFPATLEANTATEPTFTTERWSGYITYDRLPTAPSNPGATAITTNSITWTWQDNSDDETGFKIYAGAGTVAPDTVTHTTDVDSDSWVHSGLDVNTQYAMQVAATNDDGNSAKTDTITAWTLAVAPVAPVVGNPTASTLDMSIGVGDGNPVHTEYALYCVTTDLWVQADGTLDAMAVWQTAADWDTVTVVGLHDASLYSFLARARNGAGVETADSPSAPEGVNYRQLTYTAGANGMIDGDSPQIVPYGGDGAPVTAVSDPDYRFSQWSDERLDNPRVDTNVTGTVDVTAMFMEFLLEYSGDNPLYASPGVRVEITVLPVNAVGMVYYQWYRIANIKTLDEIHGAQEATLVIDPVTDDDAGGYVCIATDDVGSAQSPEILLIVGTGLSATGMITLLLVCRA